MFFKIIDVMFKMHVFVLVSVVIFGAAMILLVVVVANLGSGVLQVIISLSHGMIS